ncbi:YhcH/YjgK/YiaL family protein [uncultured Ruthenibacterium sp.]|uniref:YhcH/YjgK/YiaL family protein n=1 Tax=uncultured Ruthenibacterium sp. TaxID=1905347 RepID=UPI00349E6F0C
MILTSIYDTVGKKTCPKAVERAIEYLQSHNFMEMEPGEYPIEGKKMFAKVFDATPQIIEDTHPELHKEYADVQFWQEGDEWMGYALNRGDVKVIQEDVENDLYFTENIEGERFIPAQQGDVIVFFPGEIHRPAIKRERESAYRKVVVKVSAELL